MSVLCYSYIRFSTVEQGRGDSLRRQISRSREYAAEQGLILDENLQMTDAGVSAWDQSNVESGALGEFLEEIKKGRIPEGSFLLIEALDRLTRAEVFDALSMFIGIIRAGVRVVTLDDKTIYDRESVKDTMRIVVAIIYLSRGYNESTRKSDHGRKTWEEKRLNLREKRLTKICPGWLKPSPGKLGFDMIPERAEIVRWIYRQALVKMGKFTMAKILNDQNEPVWGLKGRKAAFWRIGYISKILNSPAVFGRFQPRKMGDKVKGERKKYIPYGEPIEGYYPEVITREQFYEVQALRLPQAESAGRVGDNVSNLFTHVAKCGITGAAAGYFDKGKWQYLKSTSPEAQKLRGWPYQEFETLFLETVGAINIRGIFEHSKDELRKAEGALMSARAILAHTTSSIENLIDAVEKRGESVIIQKRLDARIAEAATQRAIVDELSIKADHLRHAADNAEDRQATLKHLLANSNDVAVRLLLRGEIKRLVKRIDVFFEKRESSKELAERKAFEKEVQKVKKKGVKIFGQKQKHSRWMSITFKNGVRRTSAESPSGRPFVYEGDVAEAGDFQFVQVLFDPGTSQPKPVKQHECLTERS